MIFEMAIGKDTFILRCVSVSKILISTWYFLPYSPGPVINDGHTMVIALTWPCWILQCPLFFAWPLWWFLKLSARKGLIFLELDKGEERGPGKKGRGEHDKAIYHVFNLWFMKIKYYHSLDMVKQLIMIYEIKTL